MDSHDVRNEWADRSGAYSPAYYAHLGPDGTSAWLRETLDRYVDRDAADAAVLELGCGSGRHLAHLADNGYEDLSGVDINDDAFDVMAEHYPALAADGTFHCAAIEDVVGEFDDDAFDAVFSVETLQHVHPDAAWVFDELARITGDLLVTVENEGASDPADGEGDTADATRVDGDVPLYYRDWNRVFTDLGLTEVAASTGDRDVARAFRVES